MLIAANAFVNAYLQSDFFGKAIFWALFLLSVSCWVIALYKWWQIAQVRRLSCSFFELFLEKKEEPLTVQFSFLPIKLGVPHPFFEVYKTAKLYSLQMFRNKEFLSSEDLALIEGQTLFMASSQYRRLESNLYLLSTIATLGPFFGLLGTVWGILLSLSEMPKGLMNHNAMLSGLSMALATTVVGLVIAIPALVGYNMLRNAHREYKRELDHFVHLLLAAIEMQHRKEYETKTLSPL
jgi:biopolymer transport protein TolQ